MTVLDFSSIDQHSPSNIPHRNYYHYYFTLLHALIIPPTFFPRLSISAKTLIRSFKSHLRHQNVIKNENRFYLFTRLCNFLLFYFFNFERLMRGNNWLVLQFVDLCGECHDMGWRFFGRASSYLWLIQKLNSESPKHTPPKLVNTSTTHFQYVSKQKS